MSRGLFNWTFTDVEKFLKKHHFSLSHTKGSHHYYLGNRAHIVCVPFHGSRPLKPRTLKGIMAQSGLPVNVWLGKGSGKEDS